MNNKLKKPSPDYLYEILAWQDFADDELEQALGSEQNDWMPPQAAWNLGQAWRAQVIRDLVDGMVSR